MSTTLRSIVLRQSLHAACWLLVSACADRRANVSRLGVEDPCPGVEYGAVRTGDEFGRELMFDADRRIVVLGEYGATTKAGTNVNIPFVARFSEEGEPIDSRSLVRAGATSLNVLGGAVDGADQFPVVALARSCKEGFYLFRYDGAGQETQRATIAAVSQVTRISIDPEGSAFVLGRIVLDRSGQTVVDETNLGLSKQPWAPAFQDVVYKYDSTTKEVWRRNLLRQDTMYAAYAMQVFDGNANIAGLFVEPPVPFTTRDTQVLSLDRANIERFSQSTTINTQFEWRDLKRGGDGELYLIGDGTFRSSDGSETIDLSIAKVNENTEPRQLIASDGVDRLFDAQVDATGATTALGTDDDPAAEPANRYVVTFASSGTRGWLTRLSARDGALQLNKLLVLPGGDVLLVGQTNGVLGSSSNSGGFDLALVRLGSDGTVKWSRTYDGATLAPLPQD